LVTSSDAEIADAIAEVARTLPSAQLRALAAAVERCPSASAAKAGGVAGAVSTPAFAGFAARLIDAWNREAGLNGAAVATALRAAGRAAAWERELEDVEVVWTGPAPPGVPVRSTSAVIADVAAGARTTLLLMTYAAYKVPAVVCALEAACERGVQVDLVLEREAASGGKLRFDARKAFGDLADEVRLWEWPLERRPKLEKGHAVLHAKAALADEDIAFVTSANLTGLGLDENIELGLLVRGGPTPRRIARYVRELMAEGMLLRI
jgi:phosphatidylserine/phosphatidylglycerophosphate/cardiolipin synthase-like enzyme